MASTAKVSLTMERHALGLARTAAERTGVSLSSLVSTALERHLAEVIAELERRRAAEEVIATFPPSHLPSVQEQRELLALWSKAAPPPMEAEVESTFQRPAKRAPRGAPRRSRSKSRRK
jgi:hypothetical protein